uniref:BPTI/Kunitz inhibitor domain-containing protein n=1 Tax=Romanomermis culicivorax TaxID=13658 RepID=A0A915KFJ7_ROMCU
MKSMQMFIIIAYLSFFVRNDQSEGVAANEKSTKNVRLRKQRCHLKPKVGHCKMHLERYFFNDTVKSCQKFFYGGCSSNGNNFVNKSECIFACHLKSRDVHCQINKGFFHANQIKRNCYDLPESSPCKMSERRYLYNGTGGSCKTFTFGGCRYKGNNFGSVEKCVDECIDKHKRTTR